VSFYYTMMEDK